jgi:TfoX/Sxy family transcriptional regulator of competence genes
MAFDEGLAQRIRDALRDKPEVGERKMFGGVCFTWRGLMLVGVVKDSLMARIGEAAEAKALTKPGARPMDFTGKPMKGYVFVDSSGLAEDRDLEDWISLAKAFVETLPPKVQSRPRLRLPPASADCRHLRGEPP